MAIFPAQNPLVRNRGQQFGKEQEELADQRRGGEDLQKRSNERGYGHIFHHFPYWPTQMGAVEAPILTLDNHRRALEIYACEDSSPVDG